MRVRLPLPLPLALLVLVSACARLGGAPFQATLNTPQLLSATPEVAQTFSAPAPVTGIDVHVATYGAPADPSGELVITLRESVEGAPLATATIPGDQLGDARWAQASFSPAVPVTGSAAFTLTWTGGTPLAAWANVLPADVDGRACAGTPPERLCNDPYPGGQLVIGGQPAQGDLAFRVTTAGGTGAAVDSAVALVTGAASALLRQPLFALGWGALLLGALLLAAWGFRRARKIFPGAGGVTAPQLGHGRPHQQHRQGQEPGA